VLLPNIARFGLPSDAIDLRIVRRGAPPDGGGSVVFTCPAVRQLAPVSLLDDGLICKIRGVAYCARTSPQMANRMIDGARAVLNPFARDMFVFSDHRKGENAGKCPGFALALVAETTTGCLLGTELAASAGDVPEDIGRDAAKALLAEIAKRGCIDTTCQWTMLLLMLLATEDVSRIRLGTLSQHTIECLRLYRDLFGVTFKLAPDTETKTIVLSCLGIGYSNISRRVY
jgi:RNA 3'-terminal phosphate cyclase-like protein